MHWRGEKLAKEEKKATKRACTSQQSCKASSSSSVVPRPSPSNDGNRKHEQQSSNNLNQHHSSKGPAKQSNKPMPTYDEKLVGSIKRILYAAHGEEIGAIAAEETTKILSPIAQGSEERRNSVIESQKKKLIANHDVKAAALSPRQRLSDASDVKCKGFKSGLSLCWTKIS